MEGWRTKQTQSEETSTRRRLGASAAEAGIVAEAIMQQHTRCVRARVCATYVYVYVPCMCLCHACDKCVCVQGDNTTRTWLYRMQLDQIRFTSLTKSAGESYSPSSSRRYKCACEGRAEGVEEGPPNSRKLSSSHTEEKGTPTLKASNGTP